MSTGSLASRSLPARNTAAKWGSCHIIDDKASDFLVGGGGNDLAYGFGGDDELIGGNRADFLVGGLGFDLLTGGRGRDQFVFAEYGRKNFDFITDFHSGDSLWLVASVFKGLGKAGTTLKAKYFHVGNKPLTKNDRVIYDPDKAKVSWDRDGSGDKYATKKFAFVQGGTILGASDFDMI